MKLKKWLLLSLLTLSVLGLGRWYMRANKGFCPSAVTHPFPYRAEFATPSFDQHEELHKILAQNFSFVGKGAQSYVFLAEDGQYVIKLFKHKHLVPLWYVDALPNIGSLGEYRREHLKKKKRTLNTAFSGYKLAYDIHRKESGLFYLHLNVSNDLKKSIWVKDKIGIWRKIELDPTIFVIQKAAKTTRQVMTEALEKKDIVLARQYARSVIELYQSEYQKRIYDRDHGVLYNTGFVGAEPVRIDLGKLVVEDGLQDKEFRDRDLAIIVRKFDRWMEAMFPDYREEIVAALNSAISSSE